MKNSLPKLGVSCKQAAAESAFGRRNGIRDEWHHRLQILLMVGSFVIAILFLPSSLQAGIMIGGNELSGTTAGPIAADAIVLDFLDVGANEVQVTITLNLDAYKTTAVYFNVDYSGGLTFAHVSDQVTKAGSPTFSPNGVTPGGVLAGFDIEFLFGNDFGTPPPDKSVYKMIGDTTLTASLFNVANANGLTGGAHINLPGGTGAPDSGKYGSTASGAPTVVPEPASFAIWSLVAVGCGGIGARRRRRSKKA